jgi:hypothetical protein
MRNGLPKLAIATGQILIQPSCEALTGGLSSWFASFRFIRRSAAPPQKALANSAVHGDARTILFHRVAEN